MTDRHLDDGLLQAYIDGELSRPHAAAAAQHLAACEACSAALAEAEQDSSFFAAAFAPDDSLSVPTAALRARLNAAVARLEAAPESEQRRSQGFSFGGLLSSLSGLFNFTPRAAAAFATLLVAVAAGVIYLSSQKSRPTPVAPGLAHVEETPAPTAGATTNKFEVNEPESVQSPAREVVKSAYVAAGYEKRRARLNGVRRPAAAATPRAPQEEVVPGEKTYQTAIASLEKTIKLGGDESLRPALRADYERNLAVLDSAIKQTREVAAQNPKDKDAVGFLLAAYQSKVELLTRVADQAQVAALGR